MSPDRKKLERMEKEVGHAFKDPDLLPKALTHSSHANEALTGPLEDNEVLEFLGDSVIGLIVRASRARARVLVAEAFSFDSSPSFLPGKAERVNSAVMRPMTESPKNSSNSLSLTLSGFS